MRRNARTAHERETGWVIGPVDSRLQLSQAMGALLLLSSGFVRFRVKL